MSHMLVGYALIMLMQNDSVLMLKRSLNSSFEPGSYSLPGGRVEKNESFKQALIREAKEELDITIHPDDLEFVHTFYRNGGQHELMACIFKCTKWQGDPYNKEPEKHDELRWITFDHLPGRLIPAHQMVWENIKQGKMYSEFFMIE